MKHRLFQCNCAKNGKILHQLIWFWKYIEFSKYYSFQFCDLFSPVSHIFGGIIFREFYFQNQMSWPNIFPFLVQLHRNKPCFIQNFSHWFRWFGPFVHFWAVNACITCKMKNLVFHWKKPFRGVVYTSESSIFIAHSL